MIFSLSLFFLRYHYIYYTAYFLLCQYFFDFFLDKSNIIGYNNNQTKIDFGGFAYVCF